MKKLRVSLDKRSYDIMIDNGALKFLPEFLLQKKYTKIIIITDENVAEHHLEKLNKLIANCEKIIIPAGEKTKSFNFLEKICEEILSKGIDRKSLIIALGGGVVGDLSGFIASILLRGIDFIQIPTTLLAMVDSSVGGKTAINSKLGKNLIGSFYQPKLVICDLDFLSTLPARELKSGYGEVLKYGLIFDYNFFVFLEQNYKKVFALDMEVLRLIISRSCEIKAEIVACDEKESNERALLNFGHTIGHVFETETNYSDDILHGEAVAMGMLMAAEMSVNLSMINIDDFNRIKLHLENCGFVINPKKIRNNWSETNLINHLYKDKKNEDGKLTFILLEKIGKAVICKAVNLLEFQRVLTSFLKS